MITGVLAALCLSQKCVHESVITNNLLSGYLDLVSSLWTVVVCEATEHVQKCSCVDRSLLAC